MSPLQIACEERALRTNYYEQKDFTLELEFSPEVCRVDDGAVGEGEALGRALARLHHRHDDEGKSLDLAAVTTTTIVMEWINSSPVLLVSSI